MKVLKKGLGTVLALLFCTAMAVTTFGYTADLELLLRRVEGVTEPGQITYTSLYDIDAVTKGDLKAAAQAGLDAGGKVFFRFETLRENTVVGRVTVNPLLVQGSDGDVYNFMLEVDAETNRAIRSAAEEHFGQKVAVITCGHYNYGMSVVISAKVDLDGMDGENLVAWSYNAETGSYTELPNANCFVDDYGFLHLQARQAGYIIVLEG